jgi:hypothetical protein
MDDTVCGGVIVQTSRGMCSLARVSTALGVQHLIAQFGLTFTSTCLGWVDLSSYLKVVEMHTWSSDWKRVIIIIIMIIIIIIVIIVYISLPPPPSLSPLPPCICVYFPSVCPSPSVTSLFPVRGHWLSSAALTHHQPLAYVKQGLGELENPGAIAEVSLCASHHCNIYHPQRRAVCRLSCCRPSVTST